MIDEIENLPEVSFIDYITLDDVQRQMVSDYQERYETLTGTPTTLGRADPPALVLYACSIQIYQALLYVDRAGKQDLLKYSYGEFMDNLAALKGIKREPAKAAVVKVKFTLSGLRPHRSQFRPEQELRMANCTSRQMNMQKSRQGKKASN